MPMPLTTSSIEAYLRGTQSTIRGTVGYAAKKNGTAAVFATPNRTVFRVSKGQRA